MSLIKKSKLPVLEIILVGFLPSFIKVWIYKLRGARIGKGVSIGLGSVVVSPKIEIGDYSQIGFLAIVRGREVKIGKRVTIGSTTVIDTERIEIGDETVITEQVFIGGNPTPESIFKIGKRSTVMHMSFLNPTKRLIIGDDTVIGGHCLLFTHGAGQSILDGYPVKFDDIIIGNNVWLPWRVFVMPGVTIGDNTTIGANSFVNKSLPAGCLATGNPAKIRLTSENYPTKLNQSEKDIILKDIIRKFCKNLEYHFFSASIKESENYWQINVVDSKKKNHKAIYRFDQNADLSKLTFDNNSVLLTLPSIEEATMNKILASGSMIINIEKRERIGTTDIGEELILSLNKHGIKFNRED